MIVLNTRSNIFDMPKQAHEAVCVTTNGDIKKNGHAVMGKGIALEADHRFCLSGRLGSLLDYHGNHAFCMGICEDNVTGKEMSIITFPTKQHWQQDSDYDLIKQSAKEIVKICNHERIRKCYLPPVGCGCGRLDFDQVRAILEQILDDRFVVIWNGYNKS